MSCVVSPASIMVTGVHTPRTPWLGTTLTTSRFAGKGSGMGLALGAIGPASGSYPPDTTPSSRCTRTAGGGTVPGMYAEIVSSLQLVTVAW